MTHRGPFQPLLFCDSVILWFCDSVGWSCSFKCWLLQYMVMRQRSFPSLLLPGKSRSKVPARLQLRSPQLPVGLSRASASALYFLPFYHSRKTHCQQDWCFTARLPFTWVLHPRLLRPAHSGEEQNNRRIKASKGKYSKKTKIPWMS